ncbi:type II toxin-antitoxin system VapC family toxin [Candidatus Roizmanbacteria bacterium]|nr:type II toxin-antitoxin system VapC family toxin [Candidatus Roizmanbacteria bacterium]
MDYLIDTDVCIDFLKDQKPATDLFHKLTNESIKISVITLIEIGYGIEKSYQPEKKKKQFRDFINEFSIAIIPVDSIISEEFVRLKIELERQKHPLSDFDLLIAATAMANNLLLATRNIKHFKRIKNLSLH